VDGADDLGGSYGVSDEAFYQYLQTLGIRTFEGNGSNKAAFAAITEETAKRNW